MVHFLLPAALCIWTLSHVHVSTAWIHSYGGSTRSRTASFDERKTVLMAANTADSLPELSLYNSKSRSKEFLKPLEGNKVSMYTCGPTVYDHAHVGNFRAFLTYDLIKRVLLYFGYEVHHICNLTDVDDKIINRANEQNIKIITDLTRKYEDLFLQDLHTLNVIPADGYPRATEHIQEMMDMILELAQKDLAYEAADGSWYFATNKKQGYGEQLVQLNFDEMETTERGEGEMKQNPQDFCLWKAFKPGVDREDAAWESSQIKKGRPGWHLECSAMARKYLGDTIDIHGGGVDLKFPHHENEIAQSEGATGKIFCNCWLHNGFVNINDEKMSKSLGNFLTLRGACPQAEQVRAYRYLVISSQYRNPLSFTSQATDAARSALKRIDKVKNQISDVLKDADLLGKDSALATQDVPKALQNFETALLDDLSMPRAAASLFGLIKAAEKEFKRVAKDSSTTLDLDGLKAVAVAMEKMDTVFGIFYEVPLSEEEQAKKELTEDDTIPDEVNELVSERTKAKDNQDWDMADSLRARIAELGFVVKDVKGGDPVVSRVE